MLTVRVTSSLVRQLSFAAFFGLFFAASSYSYQVLAPFWSAKIDSALRVRDTYYRTLFQDSSVYSLALISNIQKQELCGRLSSAPDTVSPWYHFLCGILECNKDRVPPSSYFASAIALTQQDPGMTWALFVEFTRNRQTMWAERCLMHLEKLLLASGARSAPVIAQQILYYAVQNEKSREYTAAFSLYSWAERFDPDLAWPALHRLWNCIPSHPQMFFTALGELATIFSRSWVLQLALFSHGYEWVRYFLIVFVVIVFAGAGLKYLPQAIHPFADRLPESIPQSLKTVLPLVVLLSFLSFGLVPFLWLVAFCIWRFLFKMEKITVFLALVLLVCSPLDTRIRDAVIQARSPQGSLSLYMRALQEGYSADVHQTALKQILINRRDALAHAAVALSALKQGDTAAARSNAAIAVSLRPDDPVLLQYAGIAAYVANDNKDAVVQFQTILNRFPDNAIARFNIAQCYARHSDTTMDMDFMKTLPPRGQTVLIDFINANNVYFPKNWPALRQCIMPAYPPPEFWARIFPLYSGSWNTTRNLWGISFFGIPPKVSLFVFIGLLLAVFFWSMAPGVRRRVQQISTCRLCKRIICKSCKKGELCPSCSQATQFIRNVKTLANIQSRIMRNRRLTRNLAEYLLDICLPGGGMLFSGRYPMPAVLAVIVFSSAVYALFLFLSNAQFVYPHTAAYGIMEKFPFLLAGYNLLFIIRAIYAFSRKKETVLL